MSLGSHKSVDIGYNACFMIDQVRTLQNPSNTGHHLWERKSKSMLMPLLERIEALLAWG